MSEALLEIAHRVLERKRRDRIAIPGLTTREIGEPRAGWRADELVQRERWPAVREVLLVKGRPELVAKRALAHMDEPRFVDRRGGGVDAERTIPLPHEPLALRGERAGRARGEDRRPETLDRERGDVCLQRAEARDVGAPDVGERLTEVGVAEAWIPLALPARLGRAVHGSVVRVQ